MNPNTRDKDFSNDTLTVKATHNFIKFIDKQLDNIVKSIRSNLICCLDDVEHIQKNKVIQFIEGSVKISDNVGNYIADGLTERLDGIIERLTDKRIRDGCLPAVDAARASAMALAKATEQGTTRAHKVYNDSLTVVELQVSKVLSSGQEELIRLIDEVSFRIKNRMYDIIYSRISVRINTIMKSLVVIRTCHLRNQLYHYRIVWGLSLYKVLRFNIICFMTYTSQYVLTCDSLKVDLDKLNSTKRLLTKE